MRRQLGPHEALTALAIAGLLVSGCAGPPATPAGAGSAVPDGTIEIVARDIAFAPARFELPADTRLHVRFRNEDADVPHGLVIATRTSGVPPRELGELPIVEGPAVREFDLQPLGPGPYLFSCPVHPNMQIEVDVL